MNKAIFLDRDGVINDNTVAYYIFKPGDFKLNRGVIGFLKEMLKRSFILIIISNQGGIAKRIYSKSDVDKLHSYFKKIMKKENIQITDIYYCPHHPDIEKCFCRKPDSLLLEKAIAKYDIDRNQSYFIGDSKTDIEAGLKAGLNTIKTERNQNLLEIIDQIK